MKFGSLLMPSHPPEVTIREGQNADLAELERLDAIGFDEAWIIAGLTPSSANHKLAGEKDYLPVSLSVDPDASITAQHFKMLQKKTGGFGYLVIISYDATNEIDSWERSLRLLIEEVAPLVRNRSGVEAIAAR